MIVSCEGVLMINLVVYACYSGLKFIIYGYEYVRQTVIQILGAVRSTIADPISIKSFVFRFIFGMSSK